MKKESSRGISYSALIHFLPFYSSFSILPPFLSYIVRPFFHVSSAMQMIWNDEWDIPTGMLFSLQIYTLESSCSASSSKISLCISSPPSLPLSLYCYRYRYDCGLGLFFFWSLTSSFVFALYNRKWNELDSVLSIKHNVSSKLSKEARSYTNGCVRD
jgi:hypothetical protein